MKTTKSKQQQTQRQVLQAAVELMSAQGFDGTSMKEIARAAGIGDATIYKYFPTKEKLVLGYFEQALQEAVAQTLATPNFDDYALQERLQRLVDAVLEQLLPDREFVALAQGLVSKAPMLLLGDALPGKLAVKGVVEDFLQTAEAAGQIAPCGFLKPLLGGLFTDYLFAVLAHWLQDSSDEFADTTRLVDLTLAVLVQTLESGLINKLSDLAGFLLRSQLARLMQGGPVLAPWLATLAAQRVARARGVRK